MRAVSATVRSGIALALGAVLAFGPVGVAAAQDQATRQALALELARVLIDEQARQGFQEQVTASLLRVVGSTLQQRLNRRLQDVEARTLLEIVNTFVQTTLTPERTHEIAARAYANHFTEPELRALLDFQRSEVGRKAARLAPVIGVETAQAVEAEIQQSPAMPRLLEDLQRAFPVLRSPESP
jgi:hypothetical protein